MKRRRELTLESYSLSSTQPHPPTKMQLEKKNLSGSGVMTQLLRSRAALLQDLGSGLSTHSTQLSTSSNSCSRGPNALFWSLWVLSVHVHKSTHWQSIHAHQRNRYLFVYVLGFFFLLLLFLFFETMSQVARDGLKCVCYMAVSNLYHSTSASPCLGHTGGRV